MVTPSARTGDAGRGSYPEPIQSEGPADPPSGFPDDGDDVPF